MSSPTPTPKVAERIEVVRAPGQRMFSVIIDGETLPWALAGDLGAEVVTRVDAMPAVTLTLVAKAVSVRDDVFADQLLEHDHGDEE